MLDLLKQRREHGENSWPPWEERSIVWRAPRVTYSIERIRTQWDYQLEGFFLAHCLGTKNAVEWENNHRMYSVRDSLGFPHATILCVLDGAFSPYGRCADLGTTKPFKPEHLQLRVLQVRGREDAIARPEFHALVRQWYVQRGGMLDLVCPPLAMDAYCRKYGDTDTRYHYSYQLNLRANHFDWGHWNRRARLAAILDGSSL